MQIRPSLCSHPQNTRKVLTESGANVVVPQAKANGVPMEEDKPVANGSTADGDATKQQKPGMALSEVEPEQPFDPSIEPLLMDNPRRFVIFPIQYPDIWQMYKKVCYTWFELRNRSSSYFDSLLVSR